MKLVDFLNSFSKIKLRREKKKRNVLKEKEAKERALIVCELSYFLLPLCSYPISFN